MFRSNFWVIAFFVHVISQNVYPFPLSILYPRMRSYLVILLLLHISEFLIVFVTSQLLNKAERNFNPVLLVFFFGLSFCSESLQVYDVTTHKIIFCRHHFSWVKLSFSYYYCTCRAFSHNLFTYLYYSTLFFPIPYSFFYPTVLFSFLSQESSNTFLESPLPSPDVTPPNDNSSPKTLNSPLLYQRFPPIPISHVLPMSQPFPNEPSLTIDYSSYQLNPILPWKSSRDHHPPSHLRDYVCNATSSHWCKLISRNQLPSSNTSFLASHSNYIEPKTYNAVLKDPL